MKNFNTLKLLILLVFFAFSCKSGKELEFCQIDRPKDLKSIDWENYNDVYTFFWMYDQRETTLDKWVYGDTSRPIKVCGWLNQGKGFSVDSIKEFVLVNSDTNIFAQYNSIPHASIRIIDNQDVMGSIKNKLTAVDITKKCYIRGKLSYTAILCEDRLDGVNCCTFWDIYIKIYSADDIYFE